MDNSTLRPLVADRVWIAERPLRFYGVPMGTRMTVVRLRSGDLWVHSPVEPDDLLVEALQQLGPVRWVVAPSKLHHLYAGAFRQRFPGSQLFVSPGLPKKRPDLQPATVLGDEAPAGWLGEIDQQVVHGHRYLDEVAFFHRDTRTLVLADLMESAHRDSSWEMRMVGRAFGLYEKPGPPLDMKLTFTREARPSIARIAGWDFDRVVLAHGHLIETGGKAIFEQAYRFLLVDEAEGGTRVA